MEYRDNITRRGYFMKRWLSPVGFVLALFLVPLQAQEEPQRGKIKKVTADIISITIDGKDVVCAVTADTKFVNAANQMITPPIQDKGFKAGAAVMFLARKQDGKAVLLGQIGRASCRERV